MSLNSLCASAQQAYAENMRDKYRDGVVRAEFTGASVASQLEIAEVFSKIGARAIDNHISGDSLLDFRDKTMEAEVWLRSKLGIAQLSFS